MRDTIRQLVAQGPLEPDEIIEERKVETFAELLDQISRPVSDEEARALIPLLATPDTSFGLAWTIVHLIETAPGWPLWDALHDTANPWVRHLRSAAQNAGLVPP